jgi:hypothetical protein
MNNKFTDRKRAIIALAAFVIVVLLVERGFITKYSKNINQNIIENNPPVLFQYNSIEYEYVKLATGELLESAKKTIATGKHIGSYEIYTYDSPSSLIYLKSKSGDYLLYHRTPRP